MIEAAIEALKPIEKLVTQFEVSNITLISLCLFIMFQSETVPTIHLVAREYLKLVHSATSLVNNADPFKKALGQAYLESLTKKRSSFLSKHHLAAAILFPNTKKLSMFTSEERNLVGF